MGNNAHFVLPEWWELKARARKSGALEWRLFCMKAGEAAARGETGWEDPMFRDMVLMADEEEEREDDGRHFRGGGRWSAYKGEFLSKMLVFLAWILVEAKDGKERTIEGERGESGEFKGRRMAERGVRWASGEEELIDKWATHPIEVGAWWEEWYYRHPPQKEEYLRRLAIKAARRCNGAPPYEIYSHIFSTLDRALLEEVRECFTLDNLMREVTHYEDVNSGSVGRGVSEIMFTRSWWDGLTREQQVGLLNHRSKGVRERIIGVIGKKSEIAR